MQSTASTVTGYLQQVPEDRRATLERLRSLCLQNLAGYEEVMAYGMPCYKNDGNIEVGFASQKNYISLYLLKRGVVDAHRTELAGASIGKGCIRFSKPEKIDFAVIERLLVAASESKDTAC
jgi:uncharacterized protein YdhG (YjbR/CyaY superfamily)